MTIDGEAVASYLNSLGSTSYAIYETLKNAGIAGKRGVASRCPVANAVYRKFSREAYVTVEDVLVCQGTPGHYTDSVALVLPVPVSNFVRDFDSEAYPDLDEEKY